MSRGSLVLPVSVSSSLFGRLNFDDIRFVRLV
jgi:hypothetical protein